MTLSTMSCRIQKELVLWRGFLMFSPGYVTSFSLFWLQNRMSLMQNQLFSMHSSSFIPIPSVLLERRKCWNESLRQSSIVSHLSVNLYNVFDISKLHQLWHSFSHIFCSVNWTDFFPWHTHTHMIHAHTERYY